MSQSNLITPYPRQAGLLYDLQLRLLAQRRYNNDILYLKPDSYLISVSTSIRAWSWLIYPEHPYRYNGRLVGTSNREKRARFETFLAPCCSHAILLIRNYLMQHSAISQHLGGKSRTNLSKTSAPQNSVNTVTSVLQSQHSDIRIGLINSIWARGIGRTSGTAGWVNTLVSQL